MRNLRSNPRSPIQEGVGIYEKKKFLQKKLKKNFFLKVSMRNLRSNPRSPIQEGAGAYEKKKFFQKKFKFF